MDKRQLIYKKLSFSLFLMMTFSYNVLANCGYSLSVDDLFILWDGQDQNIKREIFVERTNSSRSCKNYFLTFSMGYQGSYDRKLTHYYGDLIPYNIHKNTNTSHVLKDLNDIARNQEYVKGKANKANRSYKKNYYFRMDATSVGSDVRGGYYFESITVKLYSGNLNNYRFEDYRNVLIATYIPKNVALSLIDTGQSFDPNDTYQSLNFGELETNETRSFDLRVRSNAGYVVKFSSQNDGELKHDSENDRISYTTYVNNVRKNLNGSSSSAVEIARANGVTGDQGDLYQINFKIGDVSQKVSGNYTDYITVTAMTIE